VATIPGLLCALLFLCGENENKGSFWLLGVSKLLLMTQQRGKCAPVVVANQVKYRLPCDLKTNIFKFTPEGNCFRNGILLSVFKWLGAGPLALVRKSTKAPSPSEFEPAQAGGTEAPGGEVHRGIPVYAVLEHRSVMLFMSP